MKISICLLATLLVLVGSSEGLTLTELHDIFNATSLKVDRGTRGDSAISCDVGEQVVFGRKYHVAEGAPGCLSGRIGHCIGGEDSCSMDIESCTNSDNEDNYSGVLSLCGPNRIPNSVAVSTVTVKSSDPVTLSCPTGMKNLFGFTHVYSEVVDENDPNGDCERSETKGCEIFQESCTVTPCSTSGSLVTEVQMLCIPDEDATLLQSDLYIESVWTDMKSDQTATCNAGYAVLFGVKISAYGKFEESEFIDHGFHLVNNICEYNPTTEASCTINENSFGRPGTGLVQVLCIKEKTIITSNPTQAPTPTTPPTSGPPTTEATDPPTSTPGGQQGTDSPTDKSNGTNTLFIGIGIGGAVTLIVFGVFVKRTMTLSRMGEERERSLNRDAADTKGSSLSSSDLRLSASFTSIGSGKKRVHLRSRDEMARIRRGKERSSPADRPVSYIDV